MNTEIILKIQSAAGCFSPSQRRWPNSYVRVEGDGFDIIAMRGGCFYISADGRVCVDGNVGENRADVFHGLEEREEAIRAEAEAIIEKEGENP